MHLDLKGQTAGFMVMIISFLGMVLWVTLFGTIMTFFSALAAWPSASAYIVFSTIVGIAPTILFIGGLAGGAFGYRHGYQQVTGSEEGVNSLMLVVFGALEVILLLAMFPSIMKALDGILALNLTNYIALSIVIQISPAILLLGGLFAGGSTIMGGAKRLRKGKKAPTQ